VLGNSEGKLRMRLAWQQGQVIGSTSRDNHTEQGHYRQHGTRPRLTTQSQATLGHTETRLWWTTQS